MGFGEIWIYWIWWSFSTTRFFVLVGQWYADEVFQQFWGFETRGLLSPYLFVFGIEAVSRLIFRVVSEGFLHRCGVIRRIGKGI